MLENRLAVGMPLQLDSTVNYVTGKTGITTTSADRADRLAVQHLRRPRAAAGADQLTGEQAMLPARSTRPGAVAVLRHA